MKDPVSIIMPCYNEEATVGPAMAELDQTLKTEGIPYELVVVDDGSTDGTRTILAGSNVPAKVVRHRGNRGYGASIKSGIRVATHERVLIMDADGQHTPESILTVIREIEDCDMVVGARRRQGSHYWRMPGKWVLKLLAEALTGRRIPDINSGLRIMRKSDAIRYMHLCSDQFSFSTSITLAFLCDRLCVRFVPIDIRPRARGVSQVRISSGLSTIMLILRTIGTFSPIRIFMPPTILLFGIGLFRLVQGLVHSNIGDDAVLCLISSIILFCFGLLADQLSLLRREINKS